MENGSEFSLLIVAWYKVEHHARMKLILSHELEINFMYWEEEFTESRMENLNLIPWKLKELV